MMSGCCGECGSTGRKLQFDGPFHRPFYRFTHEVELPQYVQEIVRRDSHEQPGLVEGEATATGLPADFPQPVGKRKRY